jgi:hypothetical protein
MLHGTQLWQQKKRFWCLWVKVRRKFEYTPPFQELRMRSWWYIFCSLVALLAMASSFLRFLDYTQRRTTVSRTPLDEWSAPSQRPLPDNKQHSQQTNIHALSGIRTHNVSRRAAAHPRLRQRGQWDRRLMLFVVYKYYFRCCTVSFERLCSTDCGPNSLRDCNVSFITYIFDIRRLAPHFH